MNINDKVTPPIRGDIELFYRFDDGTEKVICEKKNTILYEGADIMARAIAGNIYVNGMYMAYTNGAQGGEPSPPKERTASYYQDGSDAEKGFLRVPTLSQPEFSSTEDIYKTNKVSFVAISSGDVAIGVPSESPTNGIIDGTSAFYDAALAFLDPSDMENDLLFSAITFADLDAGVSHFEKIAGADIGIRWNIYIEIL